MPAIDTDILSERNPKDHIVRQFFKELMGESVTFKSKIGGTCS